jgi:hypothetical protein
VLVLDALHQRHAWQIILTTAIIYGVSIWRFPGDGDVFTRPAAQLLALPLAFFGGPAAAWGLAFGNLGADVMTGIGPGPGFNPLVAAIGFAGNLAYGLLPHLLWPNLRPLSPDERQPVTGRVAATYVVVACTAAFVVAPAVAWLASLAGGLPFRELAASIGIQNATLGMLSGSIVTVIALGRGPGAASWSTRQGSPVVAWGVVTLAGLAFGLALLAPGLAALSGVLALLVIGVAIWRL